MVEHIGDILERHFAVIDKRVKNNRRNFMKQELVRLELHESIQLELEVANSKGSLGGAPESVIILRVLGGWIYRFHDGSSMFVPLSKESGLYE